MNATVEELQARIESLEKELAASNAVFLTAFERAEANGKMVVKLINTIEVMKDFEELKKFRT